MAWLQHRWFFLCCISILVFKDCQSLFVRNTQSGKCIATKLFETTPEDRYGIRYWANLTDNCLRDDAQFRFLKQKGRTELLSNIETGGTLATLDGESSTSRYKKGFFIYVDKEIGTFGTSSKNNLKQTDDGALYFYNSKIKTCGKPDSTFTYVNNDVTSDGSDCDKPEQEFAFGSVTDFYSSMKDVGCSSKQRMLISRADYGNFVANKRFDNNTLVDTACSTITNCQVKSRCGGSTSCELTFDQSLLPSQYCPDTTKDIYTEYTCVDKYPSTLITSAAPNIRIWYVITGSISVKDANSEWIRVDDNNWSKERQKVLCQYLGLEETDDNPLKTLTFTTGKIATGDVIFYNTQGSTTSCCVSLETTTITSSTKIPAAQCQLKMCDHPIFKNSRFSLKFVFSGQGSSSDNYKWASFYSFGWCPTRSGDKYLLIDLKNDYHITRVVTLGDRDQTKWSGSYSLKYSHDKSLVDSSSVEQINGNQNGYEASYTSVNIYNARYMRIESTGTTNFCLRIEFCGQAQQPAPVKGISVMPSDVTATVSLTLEGPQSSSYITNYVVYLNGIYSTTISRKSDGFSFSLPSLKANTDYTVGIITQDSASQRSKLVSKKFKTNEAVPDGPPLDVAFKSRSKNMLQVDWKPPEKDKQNGAIVEYRICYHSHSIANNCFPTTKLSYIIENLQPSTKYTVTVSASTVIGYGGGSAPISRITNGDPVVPFVMSHSNISINISQPADYIREVMVVVQLAASNPTPSENIATNDLKPYKINTTDPYIVAYFKTADLPSTFLIGDGKEIFFKGENYPNPSLKPSTKCIVFLRFFENKDSFYSTEWSRSVTTLQQRILDDLKPVKKLGDGKYGVTLRKPSEEQRIKKVALVLVQLNSESSKPESPNSVMIQDSLSKDEGADNIAFIAKEFDIADFTEDSIDVVLQEKKSRRRKKREAVNVELDLARNTTFRASQRNTDEDGSYFWTPWTEPFTMASVGQATDKGSDDNGDKNERGDSGSSGGGVGAAIGASIGIVVILVFVVLAVVFIRRRRALKEPSKKEMVVEENYDEMKVLDADGGKNIEAPTNEGMNEGIYSNETGYEDEKTHPPVPIPEFAHYVNELKANDNDAFKNQYNDLPKNLSTSWEVSKRPFNKKKNRYGNIVTYDHCRVVLSGNEKEDYINASYIDGIDSNSYIASQGPNKHTVKDMWRMVWEQRTYSIVMVTSLIELGKPKCEKYWPDKGTEIYGDIEVTLQKTEEFAYHVTHTLVLKKDGEEREVRHYYFLSWPDHGVPKYPTQLLAFRRHFRSYHLPQSGPIVVHCSAGVGRTGVFLTIDTILEKLEKGVINSIDVFGQVCEMRERRMNMIQTLEQYIFVHEAILETILCGMNEVDSTKIQKEIEHLSEAKTRGMTGFKEKFKRLGEVSPKFSPEECSAALLPGNGEKNRNKNIYPAESNRVPLQYLDGVENSDYINAVFVHGYLGRNYFIATQSPLPNTINDFWRMVHYQKSSTIVLLNNVKEGTSFPRFWPQTRGKPTQYGSLTVQLDSETDADGICTRKFILSAYPDLSDGQVVNIFHYTKWADHRVPSNADGVITLTSLVEKSRQSYGAGPVIVACSDGAGRTGTYIAISNLLERMKIEQAVDVFQSIKIIRGHRPQFVENAEQYEFCYKAMTSYLEAFSEYANFD